MGILQDKSKTLNVRTGRYSSTALSISSQRAALLRDIGTDLASIIDQLNNVYKPLTDSIADTIGIDTLALGLSGNIIYSDVSANSGSSTVYWNSAIKRRRTVKETIDYIISEMIRLESLIESTTSVVTVDTSSLESDVIENTQNLEQLALDGFGDSYTLDGDGDADLTYPLSQLIDAIGSLFTGYVPTGLAYSTVYPTLNLTDLTSFQNLYDNGPDSISARILLDSIKGVFALVGESGSAVQDWYTRNPVPDLIARMDDDALRLYEIPLALLPGSHPVSGGGFGRLYTLLDGSVAELWYQDTVPNNIRLTNNGRIEEHILSSQVVSTSDMLFGAGPSSDSFVSPAGMRYDLVSMPDLVGSEFFFSIPVPRGRDGSYPTRFYMEIYTKPLGTVAPGSYEYGLIISGNRVSGGFGPYEVIANGDDLDPTWQADAIQYTTTLSMPTDLDDLRIIDWEFPVEELSSGGGFIPIRVARDPLDAGDTYPEAIGIYKIIITWWRE